MRTARKPRSGIYGIISKATHKVYIGSSKDVYKRMLAHKAALRAQTHSNRYLLRHFNSHGVDDLVFGVLQYCEEKDLIACEEHWCSYFESHDKDFGFNIASIDRSKGFTEEHCRKISESKIGYSVSEDARAKLRAAYYNNPPPQPSKEARANGAKRAAEKNRGRKLSESHREIVRKNIERTPERVAALADHNSKTYTVTSPTGEVFTVKNLSEFCRNNGLGQGFAKVASGHRKQYKGWKCEYYRT